MFDLEKNKDERRNYFERKIRPLLVYVGSVGAVLMSIAYIVAVCVLIFGFQQDMKFESIIAFAIANAIVGLLILFFLKIQGKDFAKSLLDNKPVIDLYYGTKTKDKKIHSYRYYMITSTLKDVLIKAAGVVITTTAVIKIVVEGNGDMSLLGLAVVNLIMFICFGFLSLVKSYDYYNEYHIPYMKEQLKIVGKELKIEPKNDIINEKKKEESEVSEHGN